MRVSLWVVFSTVLAGCVGRSDLFRANALVVEAVYPLHGANWNDYIARSNAGVDDNDYNQPDVACVGDESGGPDACLHAGEKRKVVLGMSSCAGVRIEDTLGAFAWECLVVDGVATGYSFALAPGIRLAALLNPTSWKDNAVSVTRDGDLVGRSEPAVWWGNPVEAPPANALPADSPINLDGATYSGKILVIPTSRSTSGYNLDADRLALVVMPGATLTTSGAAQPNVRNYGDIATGATQANDRHTVVAGFSQKFVWLEGSIDATAFPSDAYSAQSSPVYLQAFAFSRFRDLTVTGGANAALALHTIDASACRYEHIVIQSHSGVADAWYASGGVDNRYVDLRVHAYGPAAGLSNALRLYQENFSSFVHVRIDNDLGPTEGRGFFHSSTHDDVFADFVVVGSEDAGAYTFQSSACTYSHFTVANNGKVGLSLQASPQITLNQIVSVNNGDVANSWGIGWTEASTSTHASQIVASDNFVGGSVPGLFADTLALGAVLTRNVLLGGNDVACSALAATNGFTSACANQGASSAVWHTGITSATSFVGAIVSDDTVNTADANGAQSFSAIADWTHFENDFRFFGRAGSPFPSADLRQACSSGTCRIFDWRLRSDDRVLRNTSGDGVTQNEPFIAGAPCPSAVNGNYAEIDQMAAPHTFLANATEVIGDFAGGKMTGNDNGLCESGETCIYSPNFGAYQGEGDYRAAGACVFTDGMVSDVTLFAYPDNGG